MSGNQRNCKQKKPQMTQGENGMLLLTFSLQQNMKENWNKIQFKKKQIVIQIYEMSTIGCTYFMF